LRLVTERALDGINEMVRLEEHADRVVLHLGIGQQSAPPRRVDPKRRRPVPVRFVVCQKLGPPRRNQFSCSGNRVLAPHRAVSPRARVSGSSCGSRGRASGRPRKRQGRRRSSTVRTPTPSSRRFESGRADPPSARSKLQPSSQRSNERSSNYESRRVECQAASQSPILGERMIGTPCVGTR